MADEETYVTSNRFVFPKHPPSEMTARERAFWPAPQSLSGRTVPVHFELVRENWEWVAGFGAGHSELWNLEGILNNAIRYMRENATYLTALAVEGKVARDEELHPEEVATLQFLRDCSRLASNVLDGLNDLDKPWAKPLQAYLEARKTIDSRQRPAEAAPVVPEADWEDPF